MPSESLSAVPDRTLELPSGNGLPVLGFGTWQLRGEEATQATGWALGAGFRHLDTAAVYHNEREVGAALAETEIARDDIFVTTKIPPDRTGREREIMEQSLESLGTDHVDLWLIHWTPEGGVGADLWRAMVAARDDGMARDIGVSNYSLDQLDQLSDATGVMPAVNQIEWSPLLFNGVTLDGHRERGVVLEGYSALKGGTLEHPVIVGVADRLGKTPAQVIIRWHLQHDVVVIPKSRDRQRIASNAAVADFQLSEEDIAALDALGADD
ncbi:aldo/keto reductase [soil metagenome]